MARSPLIKPAYRAAPKHTSTAAGREAADLAASAGLVLDPEQRLTVDTILAENGKRWAAFEAAIIEARQNGKTVSLQAIALADLFLFGADLTVWTAHLFDTAQEAFRDLVALIEGAPHLSSEVRTIHLARGDEGIELTNGCRLNFLARSKTGGRGLTGDRIILDEAFALSGAEMGSLLPTMSARSKHGNPQVIYASSAGQVGSATLRSIRDRGREGGDPSLAYLEWCAPEGTCARPDCDHHVGIKGCALDDRKLWQRANPALNRRITVTHIAAERRALPPEEFARERLGWWDEPAHGADGIPLERWAACAAPRAKLRDPVTLAIDVAPGHVASSIAACGGPIEIIEHDRGSSWVVASLTALGARQKISAIGIDPSGPAGSLMPDLEAAGFRVRSKDQPDGILVPLDGRELVQACGAFYSAVLEDELVHLDQPVLNDAVAGAGRRQVGDAWKWSRRDSTVDISPLMAATVARLLWTQPKAAPKKGFALMIGAST